MNSKSIWPEDFLEASIIEPYNLLHIESYLEADTRTNQTQNMQKIILALAFGSAAAFGESDASRTVHTRQASALTSRPRLRARTHSARLGLALGAARVGA